ncbi:uncharacterized protein LOC130963140 [Arachis stenosperma]|uniref:uncharacterized protein LOC130963140 n=1 Tax=Arachis stenosperma TaxID=217475 RepID=UPI0025AD9CB3|nr:uncharacterized protein LOC130963140 [Arachis stenosperma]
MLKSKGKYKGSSSKEHKIDLSKVTCHHCKEVGHFKSNCPKLKKEDKGKKERKRVLMAAWEDLENDSNEEEGSEGDNKDCFMAGNNNLDEFVASSSNTKTIPNKVSVKNAPTFEEKFDEVYTSETERSPKTEPSSNRPGLGYISKNEDVFKKPPFYNKTSFSKGNQAQKDNEAAKNHGKENSGQAEAETANAENSRDNSILSHESEGNSADSSIQNPLVTESASKSTRPREWRFLKNYPEEFVIGDVSHGVQTRSSTRKANEGSNIALLSQMEPQNVKEALSDPSWIKAMEDELLEYETILGR